MIMAVVAIFQTLILVEVGIGKFLIHICVRNILDTNLHGMGEC